VSVDNETRLGITPWPVFYIEYILQPQRDIMSDFLTLQNHHFDPRRKPTRQLRKSRTYNITLDDLISDSGMLDTAMASWCRHRREDGSELRLWSPLGRCHARAEAERMGILSLFSW